MQKQNINLFQQLKASNLLKWVHFHSVHFTFTFINIITQHLSADVRNTMLSVNLMIRLHLHETVPFGYPHEHEQIPSDNIGNRTCDLSVWSVEP